MKRIVLLVFILASVHNAMAQRYFTREGNVKFFSEAPMENIEATTNKALCIIDLAKGQVAVDMLIKSFEFEKKLMEEHFNENYMESDKFPKATYKGKFEVPEGLEQMKDGNYLVPVIGEITIHGEKQKLELPVELVVSEGKINTRFEFVVKVEDHKIKIPNVVINNVAEEILVTADFSLDPYNR